VTDREELEMIRDRLLKISAAQAIIPAQEIAEAALAVDRILKNYRLAGDSEPVGQGAR
jgi:hypothetical protein